MICGLLLAAGGARRFKSQKLIALYRGVPLVRHAASALHAATDSLTIVVGHAADDVRAALAGIDAHVVDNHEWERGLSTSLRKGVESLPPNCEVVVVGVGDQPGLDANLVRAVIARWRETRLPIVSARFQGQRGHPVLFSRAVFPELLEMDGDAGARPMIERSAERVAYVDVDHAMPPDIDTPEQLAVLDE